jgi:hypothetical protein
MNLTTGLGAALGIALLLLMGMTKLYLGKRDDLATVQVQLEAVQQANGTNVVTITKLRDANARFVEACEADVSQRDSTIKTLRGREAAAQHKATLLDREIRRLANEDPSVEAWLRAPVPDALADRLRRSPPSGAD